MKDQTFSVDRHIFQTEILSYSSRFLSLVHRQPKLNIREPLNYKDLYGNKTDLCNCFVNKVNLTRFYLYSLSFTSFSSRFEAISAS